VHQLHVCRLPLVRAGSQRRETREGPPRHARATCLAVLHAQHTQHGRHVARGNKEAVHHLRPAHRVRDPGGGQQAEAWHSASLEKGIAQRHRGVAAVEALQAHQHLVGCVQLVIVIQKLGKRAHERWLVVVVVFLGLCASVPEAQPQLVRRVCARGHRRRRLLRRSHGRGDRRQRESSARPPSAQRGAALALCQAASKTAAAPARCASGATGRSSEGWGGEEWRVFAESVATLASASCTDAHQTGGQRRDPKPS
jgi:hypothetical protein